MKGYRYWMPRESIEVNIELNEDSGQLGKKFKNAKGYKQRDWFKTDEDCPESPINA